MDEASAPRTGNLTLGILLTALAFFSVAVMSAFGKAASPLVSSGVLVELPVPRPTSCIFGGDEFDMLYITSARETRTPEQIAQFLLSGSLFAIKPGVQGLPEPYFAG